MTAPIIQSGLITFLMFICGNKPCIYMITVFRRSATIAE